MVAGFLFKDRDGQTPLPPELQKDLIPKMIQTLGELDEYEEQNITEGLIWLEKYQKEDFLTSTFWLALHKALFRNVWKWAGKVRQHEIQNPCFLQPHQIWPAFKVLEGDLAYWRENRTYEDREFAARFHERIETIHPFPNGNGRFGRIATEYICQRLELELPVWGECLKRVPAERRRQYISSLDQARQTHRYEALIELMFS